MTKPQLNIRISEEESALLDELAALEGVPSSALARTIIVQEVRRRLGPRTEDELDLAVLNEIAKHEQLTDSPMPIDNLVWWLDKLKLSAASYKFNAAIMRLVMQGKVERKDLNGRMAYHVVLSPVPWTPERAVIGAIEHHASRNAQPTPYEYIETWSSQAGINAFDVDIASKKLLKEGRIVRDGNGWRLVTAGAAKSKRRP